MAKNNILDLETAIAGISAVVTPNPYTVGNFVSHITTGQSIGANLPGKAGEAVRGVEGAVKDAAKKATQGGEKNNKKKRRSDYGSAAAYNVGSEGQRRAEARKMKRNESFRHGGLVSHKSISACESSMRGKK